MFKTILTATIFIVSTIFTPVTFARTEADPGRAATKNRFLESSYFIAEPMAVAWNNDLKQKTQDLFEKFEVISDMEASMNLEDRMNYAVKGFTKALKEWSSVVADDVYGPLEFRRNQHKNYSRDVLKSLAKDLPFQSQKVEQLFFTTFYAELNEAQARLNKDSASLEQKVASLAKRISFTEGVAATTVAAAAAIISNHLTGDWRVADIGGFMGFLATIYALKNVWVPQIPRQLANAQMVAGFNHRIECDKILEVQKPAGS